MEARRRTVVIQAPACCMDSSRLNPFPALMEIASTRNEAFNSMLLAVMEASHQARGTGREFLT